MKKYLTQGVFFLSIFGLIWVVLNVSVRKKGDYVLRFKPSQVEAVGIQREGHALKLLKDSSGDGAVWVVQQGDEAAPADDRAVQTYLAFLARVAVVERFATTDFPDAASQERLGLGRLGDVVVHLKSGKELGLLLGREAPSGTEIYAASPTQPDTVFTISNASEKKLLPDFMGLRSRQVFPIIDPSAVAVTFQDAPQDMSPPLLKALRALVYTNYFPAVPGDDIAQYGLSLPDLSISITGKEGGRQSYDLSRYSNRYFLRHSAAGPQDVLILTGQSGDDLFKILQELVVHRR